MAIFSSSLVLLNVDSEDRNEVICLLADLLQKHGYVNGDYAKAVVEREDTYPTGLPTQGVKVAIPHAGADHVIHPAIAVAVLSQPVKFQSMENPDESLSVEIVFLLANNDSGEQLQDLQALTGLFADGSILRQVVQLENPDDIVLLLNEKLS